MRQIKRPIRGLVFLACLVSLVSLFACSIHPQEKWEQVKIKRVIDGDTVELADGEMARYIGIDCPETRRKTAAGWIEVNEPFAHEAKKANEELVLKEPVVFEFDVTKRDKYNRLLVYCYVTEGGKQVMVQSELLRQGLAYLYTFPPNVRYTDVLAESLKEAKENKRGVWSLDLDVSSTDARQFIGERKFVTGRVKSVFSTPKIVCLKMDGLNIVIFDKDLNTFLKKGIDPVKHYRDKVVRVFGLIKKYKGRPEIIIAHPSQIEIVGKTES